MARARDIFQRKTARDFFVTAGSNATIAFLTAIGGIIAARLLGPGGRGELAAAVVWAGILGTAAQLGLPQALTYFSARHTESLGPIVRATLFLYVVQSIGFLLIGWLAVGLVLQKNQPEAVSTVRTYLLSIPLAIPITYMGAMAQGLKRFKVFGSLRIGSSLGYVLSLVLASVLGLRNAGQVVLVLLLVQCITLIVASIWFSIRLLPAGHFEWFWVKRLLSYGLKSYGGSLSWIANARIDQFVMSAFVSLENLGYYAVAVSYAGVLFPVLSAFAMVLFPNVASGDKTTAGRKIKLTLRLNFAAAFAGAAILGCLSWRAIPFLFGAAFTPSIVPAIILLCGTVLLSCNYVLSDGLRGLGRPLIPTIGEVAGLVVTLVALYLLLPRWEILGAAWASVLSYGTTSIVLLVGISRVLRQSAAPPRQLS
jgi:enterobacterial common antigen flippase